MALTVAVLLGLSPVLRLVGVHILPEMVVGVEPVAAA